MKGICRWTQSFAILFVVVLFYAGRAEAAGHQTIRINYMDTSLSGSSLMIEGTTWVPLRILAAEMSYKTTWDLNKKSITLIRPGQEAQFQMRSKIVKVNGNQVSLSSALRTLKNTTYVPLVPTLKALGATPLLEKESGILQIVDKPHFVSLSIVGRTYWVSQESGELYRMFPTSKKPELVTKFALKAGTMGYLKVKQVSKEIDLVQLNARYTAMFNEFDNSYQALVTKERVIKQMDYHYVGPYFQKSYSSKITSSQIYMTDGLNVQYINNEGTLGHLYELDKTSGDKGPFIVEYATPKILLVRSTSSTALVVMNLAKGTSENLTHTLITTEDQKEWERADPNDSYVLTRMLRLQCDDDTNLIFTYTTLLTDKMIKVKYKYTE